MKHAIEIDDTLADDVETCIQQVQDAIKEVYMDYPDTETLEISDQIQEIAASGVPIYTQALRNAWHLHSLDLIDAYERAGIGSNPYEGDGAAAIYCYLSEECWEWFNDNEASIKEQVSEWQSAILILNDETGKDAGDFGGYGGLIEYAKQEGVDIPEPLDEFDDFEAYLDSIPELQED